MRCILGCGSLTWARSAAGHQPVQAFRQRAASFVGSGPRPPRLESGVRGRAAVSVATQSGVVGKDVGVVLWWSASQDPGYEVKSGSQPGSASSEQRRGWGWVGGGCGPAARGSGLVGDSREPRTLPEPRPGTRRNPEPEPRAPRIIALCSERSPCTAPSTEGGWPAILATRFRGRGLPADRYDVWMPSLGPSEALLRQVLAGRITWSASRARSGRNW